MKGIEIKQEEKYGAYIIRTAGYIDTMTAGEMEKAIEAAVNAKNHRVIVDLSGVDYISSAGWGIFVGYKKVLTKAKGDIKLCGLKTEVQEVYDVLDFTHILECYLDAERAAAAFDGKKK